MTIPRFVFPLFLVVSGLLAACGGDEGGEGNLPACPSKGTSDTYESFGKQFMADYCLSCHSSGSGNPAAISAGVYKTQAQVQAAAEEIYSEAGGTNTGMPQGTIKPSDTDRQRLADWLSCGAK